KSMKATYNKGTQKYFLGDREITKDEYDSARIARSAPVVERLRNFFKEMGVTKTAFCRKSGISQSLLYKVMAATDGDYRGVTDDFIEKAERVLKEYNWEL